MTEAVHPGWRRDAAHSALMVVLIAARPLVWDEDPLSASVTVYAALVLLACGFAVTETMLGWRTWRWGPLSVLVALLIAWLGLAAWRSPLPIVGWGLWSGIAVNGLLGAYLLQVLPERRRLALAALGAGLLGEALISVLQWPWVLPAMARAQGSGALRIIPQALQGSLAERIANGGLYGTFTQANALAGYLLLAVPPVAVASLQARGAARVLGLVTSALAGLAFLGTSSKGSIIAAGVALVAVWWWRRWPWRWPMLALAALALAAALLLPGIRHGLEASAEVRIGYWSGARVLSGERPLLGYGLGSFGEQLPRVAPQWASFSSQVHCEVLAAAAETGLPGAALLGCLLAALLVPWPRAALVSQEVRGANPQLPLPRWASWAVAGGILYLELLGLLNANTGWWPGSALRVGGLPLAEMGWWVVIAALIGLAVHIFHAPDERPIQTSRGLDLRLAVACRLAVAAEVLHCLIDFDLHAGGITGTLIVVWLLARNAAMPDAATSAAAPRQRGQALALAALVAGGVALVVGVQPTLGRLRDAHQIVDDAQLLTQPGLDREQALALLTDCSDLAGLEMPAEETFTQPQDMKTQLNRCLVAGLQLAGQDPDLQTRILVLLPAGPERLSVSAQVRRARPSSALVASQAALDLAVRAEAQAAAGDALGERGSWHAALEAMRAAVDLAPHDLAARSDLESMLRQAATRLPDEAPALSGEARDQTHYIEQHRDLVDPSNRP